MLIIKDIFSKHKSICVILLFSVNFILFFYLTTVNIPFSDDFWFLDIIHKYFKANSLFDKITILRSQFNLGEDKVTHAIEYLEHRHTIVKVLLILQIKLIGYINLRYFMLLNCFVLTITFYYFYLSVKEFFFSNILLLVSCCALFFSLVFYMNIFWFMSTPNNLLLLFGFGALYYLKKNKFYLAILFLSLALFSSYGGILFFGVSCLYLLVTKNYTKMLVLTIITVCAIYIYSFGLIRNHDTNFIKVLLGAPWYLLLLFFSCIGSIGLAVIPSIVLGIVFLGYFIYLLKRKIYLNEPYLFTVLILLFTTCLGIVIHRYDHGFSYVMTTRFKIFSVFILIIFLIIFQKNNKALFDKYNKIILSICLIYFTIGTTIAYKKALNRKQELITGIKCYNRTGSGLFINKDTYQNKINQVKINEVNTIMYNLQKDGYYTLP